MQSKYSSTQWLADEPASRKADGARIGADPARGTFGTADQPAFTTLESREALIKSVRVEPVETQASQFSDFDKLSPNGGYLFGVFLVAQFPAGQLEEHVLQIRRPVQGAQGRPGGEVGQQRGGVLDIAEGGFAADFDAA
jgi:hypothetical protein